MCGSKKTSSTTNSTQTTTPNAPSWLSGQVESLAGKTAGLASQDPYSFVAGADPLQTQAAQAAAGLGQNQQSYDTANGVLTGLAGSGANTYAPSTYGAATVSPNSILPNLDKYMSPYLNDVVNTSLANFDYGAGQTRGQNALARANSDTFGGSGGDIQTALSNAQMARDRGQMGAQLRDQGFQVGAGLAGQDADRRQQAQMFNADAFNQAGQFNSGALNSAGQFNANANDTALNRQGQAATGLVGIDQTGNADQRANFGTQTDIGSILQQIAQQRAGAPLSVQSGINSAYGGLTAPTSLLTGQTTTGTSTGTSKTSGGLGGMLGSLGSLAMGASGGLGSLFGGQMLTGAGNSLGGLAGIGSGLNLTPFNPITAKG